MTKPTSTITPDNLCTEIEACRKLKDQLRKEAKDCFPFKVLDESDITEKKLGKYLKQIDEYKNVMSRLKNLCELEQGFWKKLGK